MTREKTERTLERIRITDIGIPELLMYRSRRESQLAHCNEPAPGLFVAESPKVVERALEAGYEPVSVLAEETEETRRLLAYMEERLDPQLNGRSCDAAIDGSRPSPHYE